MLKDWWLCANTNVRF